MCAITIIFYESTHIAIVTTYLGRVEFKHEELSNKPTDGNNIEHGASKQLYIVGLQDITSHMFRERHCTVVVKNETGMLSRTLLKRWIKIVL